MYNRMSDSAYRMTITLIFRDAIKNKFKTVACSLLITFCLYLTSCSPKEEKLPIFGQREVVVLIRIAHGTAVHDHRMIQQIAVAVGGGAEFVEEIRH